MKAASLNGVLIDAAMTTVTFVLTLEGGGEAEIPLPLHDAERAARAIICDRELTIQLDDQTAAIMAACLYRWQAIAADL